MFADKNEKYTRWFICAQDPEGVTCTYQYKCEENHVERDNKKQAMPLKDAQS